ncbi:hypothetical protein LguiB_002552 [Lonicera macranthoides]
MGWKESAICMFSLGMLHYLVLFVTLRQSLPGNDRIPLTLRPVFFLLFAAPSMGSLAWGSIRGSFDDSSKMLFFLSLFLFISLVCRPLIFKKAMSKFNVAWWAYSYTLTLLALASTEYAQASKTTASHVLMLFLSALSVVVPPVLLGQRRVSESVLVAGVGGDTVGFGAEVWRCKGGVWKVEVGDSEEVISGGCGVGDGAVVSRFWGK